MSLKTIKALTGSNRDRVHDDVLEGALMLLLQTVTSTQIFGSEFLGTMLLTLLGCGVVANALLGKTKGHAGGPQFINWGWGIAVMVGVYGAYRTGGHLNPAVTLGLWAADKDLAAGIPATGTNISLYIAAQMIGGFVGAVLAWLAYKRHYDEPGDPADKLGTFATGPAIRSYGWNCLTEFVATWVLVIWVILSGYTNIASITVNEAGVQNIAGSVIGPLGVMLVIVGIGNSLGGPTGYALNPARDLGPRLAHALVPIKGKGGSDWAYAWVPIIAPIAGGVAAGLTYQIFW